MSFVFNYHYWFNHINILFNSKHIFSFLTLLLLLLSEMDKRYYITCLFWWNEYNFSSYRKKYKYCRIYIKRIYPFFAYFIIGNRYIIKYYKAKVIYTYNFSSQREERKKIYERFFFSLQAVNAKLFVSRGRSEALERRRKIRMRRGWEWNA